MKHLLILMTLFSLYSCGEAANSIIPQQTQTQEVVSEDAVTEDYQYEFTLRECRTGLQSAKTFVGICELLSNDEINQNCAEEERERLFINSSCPGVF